MSDLLACLLVSHYSRNRDSFIRWHIFLPPELTQEILSIWELNVLLLHFCHFAEFFGHRLWTLHLAPANGFHRHSWNVKGTWMVAKSWKQEAHVGHCRSPEYNERVKNLTSEWNQKQQSFIPHASRSLLCNRFVAVAFWAKKQFF